MKIKRLHLTVGLPASGKTTWGREFYESERRNNRKEKTTVMELDNLARAWDCKNYKEVINHQYFKRNLVANTIIDGLFLTEKDVAKFITLLKEINVTVEAVTLHIWNVDREACIWNDLYRRDTNSAITISNGEVDPFNNEQLGRLKDEFGCTFSRRRHDVVKKEPWQVFATKYDIRPNEKGVITSETWSGGGDWCDCWGDCREIDPEMAPHYMDELYDILEKITGSSPKANDLHAELFDIVVEEEYDYESDYYGGSEKLCWYELYVQSLYRELVERKIIEAEV